ARGFDSDCSATSHEELDRAVRLPYNGGNTPAGYEVLVGCIRRHDHGTARRVEDITDLGRRQNICPWVNREAESAIVACWSGAGNRYATQSSPACQHSSADAVNRLGQREVDISCARSEDSEGHFLRIATSITRLTS